MDDVTFGRVGHMANSGVAIPGRSPMSMNALLLRPDRGTEYCDQFICGSVCMSVSVCVSVREHISGTALLVFTKFLCRSPVAVARSSGGVAIRYVRPVLWMTSRLAVVGRMTMRGRLNL